MPAETPARRTMTARQAAEKYGVSERLIRSIQAEPREEFLARARARREQVLSLRAQGLKLREIAEQTGIPLGTVGWIVAEAKKAAQTAQEAAQGPVGHRDGEDTQAGQAAS